MDFFNLPVGKRTRHQRLLYAQGLNGIDESLSFGSSKNRDKKQNKETEFSESEDSDEVIEIEDDEINYKGSNGAGRSTRRKLDEAIKDEKTTSDGSDSEEEESDENGSGDNTTSSEYDESSSDESGEDSSDGEDRSSSEYQEDKSDEKGFDGTKSRTCDSSSGYGQVDIEIIDVDEYWINRKGYKGSSNLTKRELQEAKPVDKSLVDESEEEQTNENGSGVHSTSVDLEKSSVDVSTKGGRDGEVVTLKAEGIDTAAVAKNKMKECFGSADESDSDDMVVSDNEEVKGVTACDGSGGMNYFPPNKATNHPSANKQSPRSNKKELFSGSVEKKVAEQDTENVPEVINRKEKVRSIDRKEKGRSVKKERDNLIDDIDTHEKVKAKSKARGPYMTENIEKGVKFQESKKGNRKGYKGSSSLTKREHHEAKQVDKSLVDESEEEQSNENAVDLKKSSVDVSTEGGRDGEEETDTAAVAKNEKKECYGSADESDSDDMVVSDDEEEVKGVTACDGSGGMNYFPPNKAPNHPSTNKQSPRSNKKELFSGSVEKIVAEKDTESKSNQSDDADNWLPKKVPKVIDRKEKVRSIDRKENGPSVKKEMDDLIDDIETHENANDKGKEDDVQEKKGVKYQESKKGKRKDVGGSIDAILDSIIAKEDDVREKDGEDCIPLKFRFEESDDESEEITDESDVEALFQQMNFELQSEEIGSYGNPKAENQEKDGYEDHDNEVTHFTCERGNHGDIHLEEQTGLRCHLCGAVLLESRFVIPTLANYAPDRMRRGYHSSEHQFLNTENANFHYSDGKPREICMQTKGTVWELIPKNIQGELYSHQQEGFKFLWENLAGTIELQGLQKLERCGGGGGGGCIISHAPGTGKTLLTIVFIESFLKKFPKCHPLIIVPSSMLDTWEAEFKKWQVAFLFINLNNTNSLSKEMNISSRNNTDFIRALKLRSWCDGGSVLGVSYSLYEKIIGNTKMKNAKLEKMGNVLLDMPGLVILDEGHTPRNQRSNIWNILLKLKTKHRVILSGTPFQNNFRELFNTLQLVRPETAASIGNDKIFADMTHRRNKNKSRSSPEDIEKLKKIIAPFVNVHKGDILERKLPGLKQSIVLLNPPPLQKGLIENLDISSGTFEFEHKVALVSVHPSLILSCILTEKEKELTNKQELEKVRLHPDVGAKTSFVMEIIRLSVSLHEKVLIFSQYNAPLDLLKDQIAHVFSWDLGREIMLINGATHQKLRQTMINDFNDPTSKSKVLLASIKCCSEGIHLIGASRVVLLDIVWNPSVDTQAISRAYRLGQKKVVYTYHLMAAGTTEEEKYDTQVEKGRLAEMVFSSSASEDPKSNANKDVIEHNDKILGKLVDHPDMKEIFKKIRYLESKARI